MSLAVKKCLPCSGEVPPLKNDEMENLKKLINENWQFLDNKTKLQFKLKTKNWKESMNLLQKISEIAELENHHPDINIGFGYLEIKIWTHKINSLVEADFIFAAKCDEIIKSYAFSSLG